MSFKNASTSKCTWKHDHSHGPEQLHPAEDYLSVLAGLEFAQVREANSNGSGDTVDD